MRRLSGCYASVSSALAANPWTHWAIAYSTLLLFFFVDRCVGLEALVAMYGDQRDAHSGGVKAAVMAFGVLEDAVCAAFFVLLLWLMDAALRLLPLGVRRHVVLVKLLRGVWCLSLFLAFAAPFAADILLVRRRQMRFTSELAAMALSEKDAAAAVAIAPEELREGYTTAAATAAVGVGFALVGVLWLDLRAWDPFARVVRWRRSSSRARLDALPTPKTLGDLEAAALSIVATDNSEKGEEPRFTRLLTPRRGGSEASSAPELVENTDEKKARRVRAMERLGMAWDAVDWRRTTLYALYAAVLLVVAPLAVAAIASRSLSPLVANAALNTPLKELMGALFGSSLVPRLVDGSIASAALYLDADTETFELAQRDSLLRRTLGFRGALAFNVSVDPSDLPNVLVLVVESFRYHDSQYLVGNNTYLLRERNLTVTPHFDRWAKRGVAFRNLWSSWRTSRSVESILFGQLPLDSASDSGTTGGRADVALSGMPQLFKALGYSTKFTTGCILNYDGWDAFFARHGFDEVLGDADFKARAERELGIAPRDWELESQARAMRHWGVHDDVALEVLGNLLASETAAQRARVSRGEPKRPVFVNHYTISSHTPFQDRPRWFAAAAKPDLSPLYAGLEFAEDVRRYLEMRYFSDLALGAFLDRMEAAGVLKDTLVVVVGDHGQAPERGLDVPEAREVSATRVAAALIAEGRLGNSAGLLVSDAAEQYDLLSTLADVVGVPAGGFVQHGVGRSLKRAYVSKAPRVVYSNNPSRKLSLVRGRERLRYDASSGAVALHDVEADHELARDLFPALDAAAKADWRALRDHGRRLNGYYTHRWAHKCLLAATC